MSKDGRMTWLQITEKYPDQWVGLTDVEYKNNNDATIQSAFSRMDSKHRASQSTWWKLYNGCVKRN